MDLSNHEKLYFLGVHTPTPIQENCIPEILKGKNCIGAAKTGSGKTFAFTLPILQKLSENPYGVFALILTPTRELAFQIRDSFEAVGKVIKLRQVVAVGGMDGVEQGKELANKPHIVIATPGRLSDHLKSCNTFTLDRINFLVLDEADKLLEGSFDDDIKVIFDALPKKKQVLLFSATITDTLEKVKKVTGTDVFQWEEKTDVATVADLDQFYVLCPGYIRDAYLVETIRTFIKETERSSVIVFTDTCKNCQVLSMTLNDIGLDNVPLHSMIPQRERLLSLTKFKSNQIRILIGTDAASRGLDIPMVDLVLNYTLPTAAKDYIHRVGRTARAGKKGRAISLVTPSDIALLNSIEESINAKLEPYKIESKEVAKLFTQVSATRHESEIRLNQGDFYKKRIINKRKKLMMENKFQPMELNFTDIFKEKQRVKKKLKI
ncbi:hypothetical protein AAG570_012896 [Ranatra chinensis]|uniref:RNA helicase n=1 Tax=Ranatra chinensis TaxID=642074 RepID=A0ABD0YTU0_9HEMI